jgi:transcriptional regulator with PAS, ATPase and Fis domain
VSRRETCRLEDADAALIAVSTVFAAFGRGILCLDREFRVVHASESIRDLLGGRDVIGLPVAEILGADLFAPGGALRPLLEAGERREGWRAAVSGSDRFVSLSAAPFVRDPQGICDERVAYVLIVRRDDHDVTVGTIAPTVFSGMIARSSAMAHLFSLVQNLRTTDATILLTGESGTGKEVMARAIHATSLRRDGRFVPVNCAALPAELLESELFGHVRGAFTGAIRDRVGRVELAAGGTLFLDEIGDLPPQVQVKLLRFLQERTFERVGESVSRKADVRVIAATHVDLRRAIAEGRFRDDLYYRLRVVPIEIPPIRSRREDIEPLAQFLLSRVSARHGRSVRLSPAALRAMLQYTWPGNVREIENAIEYALAVGQGQTIQPEDLPIEVTSGTFVAEAPEPDDLRTVLDRHHWRREDAARSLGVSRTTLWRRMREAGLA